MKEIEERENMLNQFRLELMEEEKSKATVEKYIRDVRYFYSYMWEKRGTINPEMITKELLIEYKQYLRENYALSSANSMIAAINCYLEQIGRSDCKIRAYKIQRQMCRTRERSLSKEEYLRLLGSAKKRGQIWLYLIMMTICATGIRVSELPYITVESLCTRRARVELKGKSRIVILPKELCMELRRYVKKRNIRTGSIFVTKNGNSIDRNNILHAMKKLCQDAKVEASKVFPHNLRHLFAVTFYRIERDISHLADILGHSNINTTRIYTLITPEEQERQMESMGLII